MVPDPDYGSRLELRCRQGGISPSAPPRPKPQVQSVPPILRRQHQNSMPGYSKGSRGLSVFPRGRRIFTAISTSLSLGSRQCGQRYAIRAGRNLPDKEFRYLRTVHLVTSDTPLRLSRKTLRRVLPACRHADRTLSSPTLSLASGVKSLRIPIKSVRGLQ